MLLSLVTTVESGQGLCYQLIMPTRLELGAKHLAGSKRDQLGNLIFGLT